MNQCSAERIWRWQKQSMRVRQTRWMDGLRDGETEVVSRNTVENKYMAPKIRLPFYHVFVSQELLKACVVLFIKTLT